MIDRIKSIPTHRLIVEIIALLMTLAGVVVSIKMNLVGRSLWYDEAALAYSFVRRSFAELTATGLDLVQSAPVGWLYVVKIFCKIFGYTDFVMRVPSILAYVGVLVLMYYICSRIFKMYYPMVVVAFTAAMPLLLQYSNMFKPYITDAFVALLIICLFYWYKEKKLNVYIMALIWGALLWFSSTACFVEGGVILAAFIVSLLSRDKEVIKKNIFDLIKIGLIILVFFGIYYVYWLRHVSDGMQGFWRDWRFPLIPTSVDDLIAMKRMISTLFAPFYWYYLVMMILVIVAFVIAIIKKNVYVLSLHLTLFVAAVASFLNMYPVNKRLWLFIYPMIIYVAFYVADCITVKALRTRDNYKDVKPDIARKALIRNSILGLFLILVCVGNGGIRYYMHDENVYWPGYEVKGEYNYLTSIIGENDKVYVTAAARPMYQFYNNYDDTKLKDKGNETFIGDEALNEGYDCSKDFEYITSGKNCYIVMSDTWDDPTQYGLMFRYLEDKGTLEMVYNEYNTPLFLFKPFSSNT